MKKYELVLVIDAATSSDDITKTMGAVEKLVGTILETDNMGLLPVAYPVRGQNQAHYVSYYVELDPATIPEVKKELKLMKPLAKFFFYKMNDTDAFLKFADLKKQYEEMTKVEEKVVEEEAVEETAEEQPVATEAAAE